MRSSFVLMVQFNRILTGKFIIAPRQRYVPDSAGFATVFLFLGMRSFVLIQVSHRNESLSLCVKLKREWVPKH